MRLVPSSLEAKARGNAECLEVIGDFPWPEDRPQTHANVLATSSSVRHDW